MGGHDVKENLHTRPARLLKALAQSEEARLWLSLSPLFLAHPEYAVHAPTVARQLDPAARLSRKYQMGILLLPDIFSKKLGLNPGGSLRISVEPPQVGVKNGIELGKKGHMSKTQVTIPLELPEARALKSGISHTGTLIITIESTKDTATCHRCRKTIQKFHGHDDWLEIRYLPVFGRPTYLRYWPKRYRCENCDGHPTSSQGLDWHEPHSPNAFMHEQHLLLQLVNATIEDVAVKEQISAASIVGILERYISARVDWSQFTRLGQLGLDEIALTFHVTEAYRDIWFHHGNSRRASTFHKL